MPLRLPSPNDSVSQNARAHEQQGSSWQDYAYRRSTGLGHLLRHSLLHLSLSFLHLSLSFLRLSLRGSANRRVAYVSRNNGKAVESLLELPSMKSCQPIGGSS